MSAASKVANKKVGYLIVALVRSGEARDGRDLYGAFSVKGVSNALDESHEISSRSNLHFVSLTLREVSSVPHKPITLLTSW